MQKLSWLTLLVRVKPYFRQHARRIVLATLLMLFVVALNVLQPLVLMQIIDVARLAGGADVQLWTVIPVTPDRSGLMLLAGIFVAVIVTGFVLEARLGYLMADVGISVVTQLKEDLFRKILTLDPEFFRARPPGKLIARVESDAQSLKNLFSTTGLMMTRAVLTFFGILGIMLWKEPRTGVLIVPLVLMLAVASVVFVRVVNRFFEQSRALLSQMTGYITEQLQGISVLQHYGRTGEARRRLHEINLERYRVDSIASMLNYGFLALFGACEIGAAAVVVWACAGRVVEGTLTLGILVAFLEYLRRIFMPIQMLSEFIGHLQQGTVAATRIFSILATERTHPDPVGALEHVRFDEAIRFEDVSFSYDGTKQVLDGVDFCVPRGARVALVGPSGGGKSTLVKLLLRFHEPTRGRITVDGVDLREHTRAAWRDRIGLVQQEVYLFPGTLGQNLACFDPRKEAADLQRACAAVGAEELVARFPGGLGGDVAERGGNLSHGERQLLSLTRALVHDPEILVLDEATSAIDPATERRIQDSIDTLLAGRTALIVAHRLSTITSCDEILVIDEGRIIERGTHDELWARTGSAYRALAALQFDADHDAVQAARTPARAVTR